MPTLTNNNDGGCGFVAGTLLHTKGGVQPIEDVKVGELVLSHPIVGGNQEYKRVVSIGQREQKAVSRLRCFMEQSDGGKEERLIVTSQHTFFVSGHNTEDVGGTFEQDLKKRTGWREVWALEYGALLKLASGKLIRVGSIDPIWITRTEGVGWIDHSRWNEIGNRIDFRSQRYEETFCNFTADFNTTDGFCDRYDDDEIADDWAYKCDVYNLEVEDFHTYYVGELGILVHDGSCAIVESSNSPIWTPPEVQETDR
jgi:hypothetical protein